MKINTTTLLLIFAGVSAATLILTAILSLRAPSESSLKNAAAEAPALNQTIYQQNDIPEENTTQ